MTINVFPPVTAISGAVTIFNGTTDSNNSSTTPLGSNAVFTGTATDCFNQGSCQFTVTADQNSAVNGVSIQWSSDGTHWDETFVTTYLIGLDSGGSMSFGITHRARYFRVVYTNGAVAQTAFRLAVIHKITTPTGTVRELNDTPSLSDHAQLTTAMVSGVDNSGGGVNLVNTINPSAVANQKTLMVAQSATNFVFSSLNSTSGIVPLTPGQSFTGTIETILYQTQLSILLEATQNGVLTVNQFITNTDPFPAVSQNFNIQGGIGFSQAVKGNGNYAQVLFQNTGQSTSNVNINVYYGTITESTQVIGTFNQTTGLPETLQNGDNLNDYDAPSGNVLGTSPTGLLGAEAYPRYFDGVNWQRQRGQIDQGLRVYNTKLEDAVFQLIAEVKTLRLVVQQGMGISDNFDAVSNEISQSIQ